MISYLYESKKKFEAYPCKCHFNSLKSQLLSYTITEAVPWVCVRALGMEIKCLRLPLRINLRQLGWQTYSGISHRNAQRWTLICYYIRLLMPTDMFHRIERVWQLPLQGQATFFMESLPDNYRDILSWRDSSEAGQMGD